jgi:hypothetical protein
MESHKKKSVRRLSAWAKLPVHLFLSIFLRDFHLNSKIPLPLWTDEVVLHHAIATLIFILQKAHPLNAALTQFTENFSVIHSC